jgi:hypothetical protein
MKRLILGCFAGVLTLLVHFDTGAREMVGVPERELTTAQQQKLAGGCEAASAHMELNINNVRARIMNGGDMWWDLVGSPRYEVPKVVGEGTRRHSMFAGSLWIGGFDPGGNLRLAAMTYRQSGEDFWPGPLDTTNATTTREKCNEWDRMWRVTREEIDAFRQDPTNITEGIEEWPAHGKNPGEPFYLAPFVDVSGTGVYEPHQGDYPDITGDQSIWYVYNDRGNVHTETGASAIGLEVRSEAFAFSTNNELNNATFYDHTVINRSRDRLDSTFFGKWADPDVGYAFNDYVGSRPDMNLGFAYVGEEFDPGATGYGFHPPAIGTIFFQGPRDDEGNEIPLSNFIYYNNTFAPNGNPTSAIHYYNYLNAHWKNGDPMCWGGDGFTNCWDPNETAEFMYPHDPRRDRNDGCDGPGGECWSEVSAGNPVGDRRHLQAAGPFTLLPGAVNSVTVGIVWARTGSGGNLGSLDLLFQATERAQDLFDNDFEMLDGPNAPDLAITELDRKLVINFDNFIDTESYIDTQIVGDTFVTYEFQGYRLFQLRDDNVGVTDLSDPDKADEIFQVDIEDGVDRVINHYFDFSTNALVPELEVDGSDQGIRRTFEFTRDRFASRDDRLNNYSPYHFMVVAYAVASNQDMVDEPYLQGRLNVRRYTAIPHNPKHRFGGAIVNADYNDQPPITRIQGFGNSGLALEVTDEMRERILRDVETDQVSYKKGYGPLDVRIFNPLIVPDADFELRIEDPNNPRERDLISDDATWVLENLTTGDIYASDKTVGENDQQLFTNYGFSITINQVNYPGQNPSLNTDNGLIEVTREYEDEANPWLTGVPSIEAVGSPFYWIRSGQNPTSIGDNTFYRHAAQISESWLDPNNVYDDLIDNGMIGPYPLAAGGRQETNEIALFWTHGPYYVNPAITPSATRSREFTPMSMLSSVDLVFTSDREKWTRSVVIETSEDPVLAQGGREKFQLRDHRSLRRDALDYHDDDEGRGWFPGYAIDVESGTRLNIIYGEASEMHTENGRDMVWNPTSKLINQSARPQDPQYYVFGGKHYTYIMAADHPRESHANVHSVPYDEGEFYQQELSTQTITNLHRVYNSAMWVMMPLLEEGVELLSYEDGLIPNDVKLRMRVNRALASDENADMPIFRFSTSELAVEKERPDVAKEALEEVRIVPNPYYAFSPYEVNQLDNRARLINLPRNATVSIYAKDGTLIRKFDRRHTDDEHLTYLDWNLTNQNGIPISSGMYIIHVEGYEMGEDEREVYASRTFKWFAVMRPLDLDTF